MARITVYTRSWCGFCRRAKGLLDGKDVSYDEIDVDTDREAERTMIRRSGGRFTVPQIFIGDRHVGGSDELYALERSGELDALLASAGGDEISESA